MIKNINEKSNILLDTNILIYSSYLDSEFFEICRSLLKKEYNFFITDRSLLEFYRVYTSKLKQGIEETLEIINFFQNNSYYTILNSTSNTNSITFELAKTYKAKSGKIFDLNILAMAIENNIDFLCTKNRKDFPPNPLVKILEPQEL
jgi:predicted nucleic acid-binding protein